ncbi:hypothetical protein EV193_11624 [Herbihabitans rhizosphaerae]|uniref:PE family protein n=1 Tax=Herbihabitans rhizosphaerae TaxID=1872711 RepID=A0A4Q7KCE1_9PSEU|nr:hypothetical protein [Herbihabitans rhizosphaerae]RZS30504.1 hypothetical protein EV193_11624 [Herbihabitans rhizosphaerae]
MPPPPVGPPAPGSGTNIHVTPENAPKLKATFEQARDEMWAAKRAALKIGEIPVPDTNPGMIVAVNWQHSKATGAITVGSFERFADSMIVQLDGLIAQIDRSMADYANRDRAHAKTYGAVG